MRLATIDQTLEVVPVSQATLYRLLRREPQLSRSVMGRRLVLLDDLFAHIAEAPTAPRPYRHGSVVKNQASSSRSA
jgi:hypothetical protein